MSPICRSLSSFKHLQIPQKRLSCDLSLYLVANRPSFSNEDLFFSKIRKSIRGGTSCVQLRDHESDFATTLKTARYLREMLKGVLFFINTLDPFKVAQAVKADGVYLENTFSHAEARKILGREAIIGIPVKTMSDVIAAERNCEVDYVSIKISPSNQTCPRNDDIVGVGGLRSIRLLSSLRIVAIGGLTLQRAESVYKELNPDDGIAMAGGLMRESDPCKTAQQIQEIRQKVIRGSRL